MKMCISVNYYECFISQVLQHRQYMQAKSVSVYLSLEKEVQTGEILEDIFRSGKTCFIPR
jgi:5-formyltetrahydrofolate cyclo-ligase